MGVKIAYPELQFHASVYACRRVTCAGRSCLPHARVCIRVRTHTPVGLAYLMRRGA